MNNDNNKKQSPNYQDFELGEEVTPINHYGQNDQNVNDQQNGIQIDPTDAPPTDTSLINTPDSQNNPKAPLPKPKKGRKALLGCLGFTVLLIIGYLIFAFLMINAGDAENPPALAKILNVPYHSFVNGLIASINIIILLIALVPLVLTVLSLLKFATAKKEETDKKKKSIKKTIIFGATFFVLMLTWLFLFLHLDGKRVSQPQEEGNPIVTTPEETLGLTAPIEIRFQALDLPIDDNKYQKLSYTWDFGDNNVGTGPITTNIFKKKGRFDVVLTVVYRDKVSGEDLSSKFTKTIVIEHQEITADFIMTPDKGAAPLEVNFDASTSENPDGSIGKYEWDLDNDGLFDDAEGVKVKYTFDEPGTYTIALRVVSSATDDKYNVVSKTIAVEEEQEFTAEIEVVNESEDFVTGVSYIFRANDAISPNGQVVGYSWNFSDGTSSVNSRTTSHAFKNPGTYEVALTLKDDTNAQATITKEIVVKSPPGAPSAVITTTPAKTGTSLSGKVPFTVNFSGSDSTDPNNDIVDYAWDFDGDGKPDQFGQKVSYTYNTSGNYTVTLTVTDNTGNEDSETLNISVEGQKITADLKTDKIDGNVPLTVSFDASGSRYPDGQITSYHWNFGDGTSPKLGASQISHRFEAVGTYTVTLRVIASDNTSDTITRTITVREVPLTACFSSVFQSGKAPLTTTFDPSCSTGTVKSYFWSFGTGGSSTDVKPTHTFSTPGEYVVTLEIQDNDNTVSSISKTITVTN